MDAEWLDAFPLDLRDTGLKVRGFPPWRKRTLYEYTAGATYPMTLRVGGVFIRPDRHFHTDMGSVPELAQLAVPKDLHLPSFVLHDSACLDHGLYFASQAGGPYSFCGIPSSKAHELLRIGLCAAGYTRRAWLVWAFVRAFGPRWEIGDAAPTPTFALA